jgi:excinuclease ABC subunit A
MVIEHNMDVIKVSDYIVDLGKEGGRGGGQIIFSGTPEQIVKVKDNYTGRFLRAVLKH